MVEREHHLFTNTAGKSIDELLARFIDVKFDRLLSEEARGSQGCSERGQQKVSAGEHGCSQLED